LTPGKSKKGQAVKQIRDIMVRNSDMHPLEKQCLRALPDTEMIRTIISHTALGSGAKKKGKQPGEKKKKK
jgi:hypothetical protein